ncbi:MAG: CsbD family protein [Microthrixaceae bacterium]
MADSNDSAAEKGVKGVVEDAKGRAKEAVGSIVGNDDLKQEGEAQQDKADAQREAADAQAEARKADAKAEASEARQESKQD